MSDYIRHDTDDAPISPECEAVDARLADYLDDAPDPALVAEVDAHLAGCPRCAALVGDLAGITAAAHALPPLEPARDLWAGVAERIGAAPAAAAPLVSQVVPIETARRRAAMRALPARWLAVAAAALVIVTAGVTYEVTKAMTADSSAVATQVANTEGTSVAHPTGATSGPATSPKEYVSADTQHPTPTGPSAGDDVLRSGGQSSGVSGSSMSTVANRGRSVKSVVVSEKAGYDVEIARLRRIVRERRADLDSGTVAVLDRNLKVIDEAIAQSRAALAHDPRSRFLDEQLNHALDQKIELLRTAALLPVRS